jgi:hypothetical protein
MARHYEVIGEYVRDARARISLAAQCVKVE